MGQGAPLSSAAYASEEQDSANCEEAQRNYPDEFKTKTTITKDPDGRTYRWPQS